jgi:biopolymer transport protein TolQ
LGVALPPHGVVVSDAAKLCFACFVDSQYFLLCIFVFLMQNIYGSSGWAFFAERLMSISSFIELLQSSGLVAGLILIVLAILSFLVWGIVVVKYLEYRKLATLNKAVAREFARVENFSELKALVRGAKAQTGPLAALIEEVLKEAGKFSNFVSFDTIQHRASLLEDTIQRSVESIRMDEDRMLGFLGTSSNIAPFLGLLGTVWGIMVSFYQIRLQGSADLTVVAPGISAALVTTVAGLLVAIPASASYNIFVTRNNRNEMYYYDFAARILSLFKRGDLLALESLVQEGDEAAEAHQ